MIIYSVKENPLKCRNFKDIIGQTFDRLTALEFLGHDKHKKRVWLFECSCNNKTKKEIAEEKVLSGDTRSCGCLIKEAVSTHKLSKHPLYKLWKDIKNRCYNKNCPVYYRYGCRGIIVSDEWVNSPEVFIKDMTPKLSKEHSLDRIDNDGPYSKDNCQWSTRKEQGKNKGNNIYLELDGEKLILAEWARILNIPKYVFHRRKNRGWTDYQILKTPFVPKKIDIPIEDENK